jgi:hypothetical protein
MSPLSLTDDQLGDVFVAAAMVGYPHRNRFLHRFATGLGNNPVTDASVSAALAVALRENSMLTKEVLHRLRTRANNAERAGDVHCAQDIRLGVDLITRLDREQQLRAMMKVDHDAQIKHALDAENAA